MKRIGTTVLLVIMGLMVSTLSATAGPLSTMPNVKQDMLYSEYWTKKLQQPNKIIMNADGVAAFNSGVIRKLPATVYDLQAYPESLSRQELTTLLTTATLPTQTLYNKGVSIKKEYYQALDKNRNINQVKDNNPVQYGFTVKRADLRTFPTMDAALETPKDIEFDQFQETAVEALQPLIVLHSSKDKKWFYVQTYNYRGWIQKETIGLTDKAEWRNYQNPTNFLIVTGPSLSLGYNPYSSTLSELRLGMGTKLPLANDSEVPDLVDNQSPAGNYVIKVPTRNSQGHVVFKPALVSVAKDVHEGYLPYNYSTLLTQAFKLQGERYGWGSSLQSHDCSSFTRDVYSVFGFQLPRNADEQEAVPGNTLVLEETLTAAERTQLLATLQPGALLHMNGHIMMYLGNENGVAYVIHDIAANGDPQQKLSNGKLKRVPINQVTVTDLQLTRVNGKQLVNSLHLAKEIK